MYQSIKTLLHGSSMLTFTLSVSQPGKNWVEYPTQKLWMISSIIHCFNVKFFLSWINHAVYLLKIKQSQGSNWEFGIRFFLRARTPNWTKLSLKISEKAWLTESICKPLIYGQLRSYPKKPWEFIRWHFGRSYFQGGNVVDWLGL